MNVNCFSLRAPSAHGNIVSHGLRLNIRYLLDYQGIQAILTAPVNNDPARIFRIAEVRKHKLAETDRA